MLAAIVLTCTVPVYAAFVTDLRIQQVLTSSVPAGRNVQVVVQSATVSQQARSAVDPVVRSVVSGYGSGIFLPQPTYYLSSDTMLLYQVGSHGFDPTDPRARQLRFEAFDFTTAAAHMNILAGNLPVTVASGLPQVLVTKEMADEFNLHPGSQLTATGFGDHTLQAVAVVSGVWQPVSQDDPFWNGQSFSVANTDTQVFPVLLTPGTFFSVLQPFSTVSMTQNWIYYTRSQTITSDNLNVITGNLGTLRSQLNGSTLGMSGVTNVAVQTNLDNLLSGILQQQQLLFLPLYVIVAQIVGLALLFTFASAGVLVDAQAPEIATLKSRGASGTQILSAYTLQGLLVAAGVMIVSPLLAIGLALVLVQWFVPGAATGSDSGANLVYLSRDVSASQLLLPAVTAAALSIMAVAAAVWRAPNSMCWRCAVNRVSNSEDHSGNDTT